MTASVPGAAWQGEGKISPRSGFLIRVDRVWKRFSRSVHRGVRNALLDLVQQSFGGRAAKERDLRADEFWALQDLSFAMRQGESVAVIGANGAGKSTLLKVIMGRLQPTRGRVWLATRATAVTELGLGFSPSLSGRENIYINGAILGLSRRDVDGLFDRIVHFSGLEEFIDAPVQTYSTGMRARLGFSVAAHAHPDILFVDEVLAVGDISFRRKCIEHVRHYIQQGGSMLFISHDMFTVQSVCNRAILLERGRLVYDGDISEAQSLYYEHLKQRDEADNNEGVGPQADAAEHLGASTSNNGSPASPLAKAAERIVLVKPQQLDQEPVVVESLRIEPIQGDRIRTGEPVRISFRCQSAQRHEGIVWNVTLTTQDLSINIGSAIVGLDGQHLVMEPGVNEWSCRIQRFPLQPGQYAMKLGIGDALFKPLAEMGWADTPVYFWVDGPRDQRYNAHRFLFNLIELDIELEDQKP